jgi:YidC/Oxa1 family membrane protein insertase
MSNKFFRFALFALLFLIAFQFFKGNDQNIVKDDVVIVAKSTFPIGKDVTLQIQNNSNSTITIPDNCPKNPLTVEKYVNGEWILAETEIDAEKCKNNPAIDIAPGKKYMFSFKQWGWQLFSEEGRYKISLKTSLDGKEKDYSHELTITKPSLIRKFWLEVFYKPILNTLLFLIFTVPGRSLGLGIILLTIIIKLILLGPNHKALKAQKAMQKIQPQLEALKIKYKDDQQQLAKETMEIWKKHKVNPMSSCLPILIQFPVLIALFYVVKDGLGVINPTMLYSTLKGMDLLSINPVLFGLLDLTKINPIVLPIIIGGLQFFQMRLALAKSQTDKPAKSDQPNPMPMMNKMMQYLMPIMIAVFTAGLPAAVGLYWGTSTLFGIGQQMVVNRSKE